MIIVGPGYITSVLNGFVVSDIDTAGDPKYYGFVDTEEGWYMMEESAGGSFRFTKGQGVWVTVWGSRATMGYGYFYNIF